MSTAGVVIDRIERLARISAYPWKLTRRVFSPKQAEAEALVIAWMKEVGLSVRHDPAGNLVGRLEGSIPGAPAIVIGGHVDTGDDAGRHDGTLGVLMGIATVERLVGRGTSLRHPVEVVAFAEDAAARFGLRRFGSRVLLGRLDPQVLDWDDDYGVTLRQAMEGHGLAPASFATAKRSANEILAYLEVAVEAGPFLERMGSPVGVVPALTESAMLRVSLTGAVASATTIPMSSRRDALAGAAECILEAERIGSSRESVTVTVVRLDLEPAPIWVVAGSAKLGILVDSADDAERRAAMAEMTAALEAIAERRRLGITIEHGIDPDATQCDPGLVRLFERAIEASGNPVARLAQGMTTAASNMAVLAPIGSALIRCRGGVGWGPAGSVEPADVAVGLDVLTFVIGALVSGTDAPTPRVVDQPGSAG